MMQKPHQIYEYGYFVNEDTSTLDLDKLDEHGVVSLSKGTFEALERFVLENCGGENGVSDLMGLSIRKNIGKVITVKNYVGTITMKDGTIIEILPKICSKEQQSPEKVKQLLVDMLKSLRDLPFKTARTSKVDVAQMPLSEIFIRMFVDEVIAITKRGLRCGYVSVEDNEPVFKGKLLVSEHIRRNYAHKERFYVNYDAFNTDRAENRLLKATLQYLYRRTESSKNKADIRTLLNAFGDIRASENYKEDFAKIGTDRNMADYRNALLWCKLFLTGKSFTSFSGSSVAFALLFPMETVYERYIADQLRRSLNASALDFSAQDRTYHLFDAPFGAFLMKPDIVVTRKEDQAVFICDTKWKLLDDTRSDLGITQADMYQMYAYHKKYGAQNVTLIYPLCSDLKDNQALEFVSQDGVTVKVRFVDLFHVQESLRSIAEGFTAKE